MKILIGCLSLLFVTQMAFADDEVSKTYCSVKNYKDAIACIKKDSYKRYGEGEMPHSVGVTRYRKGKKAFQTLTKKKSRRTYVGVAQVHYDEDQILYYEVNKGKRVSPNLVKDYNMADMAWELDMEGDEDGQFSEELLRLHIPSIDGFHN
jgi:hypothetical protein